MHTGSFRDFDWSQLVFDFKRAGMNHGEICEALNHAVSESGIRSYMAGGQPGHWRGELLLELWSRVTGRPRSEAPTRKAAIRHSAPRRPASPGDSSESNDLDAAGYLHGVNAQALSRAIARASARADAAQQRDEKRATAGRDTMTMTLPGFDGPDDL